MTLPTQRGPDSDSIPVTLARLEGKVDAALAQQGVAIANHAADIADHETRIRAVEAKSTVSWKQLWAVVGGIAAVMTALQPYLNSLHP